MEVYVLPDLEAVERGTANTLGLRGQGLVIYSWALDFSRNKHIL